MDTATVMKTYNNDAKNLEILCEEASEVIKAKSKIFRFGFEDSHPKYGDIPNIQLLEEEIGHFLAMVNILSIRGVINYRNCVEARENKIDDLVKYYNHHDGTDPIL